MKLIIMFLMENMFWNNDKDYKKFEKKYLLGQQYTFEELMDFCELTNYLVIEDKEISINQIKNEWNKLVNNWNKERENDDEDCIFGYMGLAFLYLTLPFDKIKNLDILNDEIRYISILSLLYFNKIILIKGAITNDEILKICKFKNLKDWLEDQNDICVLTICYLFYKKIFSKKMKI